ncbi:MAG: phosphate ABC transporter substrate-binding protein PstS [Nitrosopumilus sp. H8]|nr:MAG: phosphate ABC transporter substrate-binding protein PstS [Nitrosopumilus sp. H8]
MRTAAILVLASLIALVPLADAAGPGEPDPDTEYNLIGAGATFPFPLIDLWRVEYNNIYENVHLNYQSIGSGGGIKQHIEGTVNFAASDKPMSAAELGLAPGTLHIPESIGGVVLVYNVPEIPQKGLQLTPDAISDMYLGKITRWNDPAIASENPGLDLPDAEIVTAHRSDGSGTTFIFTDYLSVVSPEWESQIGAGKSVPWPSGLAAAGNEGVAGIIKSTEYSIGYVELAYAFQTGMSYAFVQNAAKSAFIEPSLESISAASSGISADLPDAKDSWTGVSLVNAPGSDSYPIASFTYLLLYDDLEPVTDNIQQARAVIHLIHWMITDGQQFAPGLLYVPLSESITEIGTAGLKQVTYGGQQIWGWDPADVDDADKDDKKADGGGCLIATATYGTELAPQVQMLREIRDDRLLHTESGRSFMAGFNEAYYAFSPHIADLERKSPIFREAVKTVITPMLLTLPVMSHADSESEVLAYGVGVIALNLGMYVAAPAVLVYGLAKRRQ